MKITVVGGGASGCITALMMQKKFPHYDITIVESSKIGIIGVGEATAGNFFTVLNKLNIDINEFMKHTNATTKLGALFCGWNNENIDFWQPLIYPNEIFAKRYENLISSSIKNKNSLVGLDDSEVFALQNKVPFLPNDNKNKSKTLKLGAFHFDAVLCADFFKKIAVERNIKIINDLVVGFKTSGENITNILLSNEEIETDFIFDCSGFSRLIIGNFYKEKWVNVNETLPINQSIVGPLKIDETIPPYTKMTALDYGWSFKIPTTTRYGAGYNFDNNYISEDDAIIEMKNRIDPNWEPQLSLKYDAGFYQNHFVNNCLAVGLSGSFFEPLEATAILTVISLMEKFSNDFEEYFIDKIAFRNKINKYVENLEEDIIAAIYIHYVTNKTNNDFWKNFTKNNKIPKQIENFLLTMEESIPVPDEFDFANKSKSFINDFFIRVYYGNGLRNLKVINKYDDDFYSKYINFTKKWHSNWPTHRNMLESIEADLH